MNDNRKPNRPTLGAQGGEAQEAIDALARLVEELQTGWDQHDADLSNQHFAAEVMWGSPFGATVHNYEKRHAIHVRLKQEGKGGLASRFEIVGVLVPAPGVAVAQVRRVALDDEGQPIKPSDDLRGSFSEMALYVLVRRGGVWWLAAGQNTPNSIRGLGRALSSAATACSFDVPQNGRRRHHAVEISVISTESAVKNP